MNRSLSSKHRKTGGGEMSTLLQPDNHFAKINAQKKTCMNCKHWRLNKAGKMSPFYTGKCKSKKFIIGFEVDITKIDQLAYCDSEEYSASLSTAEGFGCIHFKRSIKRFVDE